MTRPHLLPAMLLSLALSLTTGLASAATVTIKCGSKNVTVSGEKQCSKGDMYRVEENADGTTTRTKVGEGADCTDNQGRTSAGSCVDGKAYCRPVEGGNTSCNISILPTPTTPPRIPGQRSGMPPAGILEDGLGGFGPQGPAPTGAPTAPPTAPPPVVR